MSLDTVACFFIERLNGGQLIPKIVRFILAVPVSVVVLGILTFPVIDSLGLWLFPLPDSMEIGKTPILEVIASRPFGAVLFNFALRLPALFLSSWLAARIASRYAIWHGIVVTLLFVYMIAVSGFQAPIPLWSTVSGLVCFPLVGYLGASRGARPPAKRLETR